LTNKVRIKRGVPCLGYEWRGETPAKHLARFFSKLFGGAHLFILRLINHNSGGTTVSPSRDDHRQINNE
jgi:hypothetical protein